MGVPGVIVRMPLEMLTPLGKLVATLIGQLLIESLRNRTEPSAKAKIGPARVEARRRGGIHRTHIAHGPARREVLQLIEWVDWVHCFKQSIGRVSVAPPKPAVRRVVRRESSVGGARQK